MDVRRWMGMDGVQKDYGRSGALTDRRRSPQWTVGDTFHLTVASRTRKVLSIMVIGRENRFGEQWDNLVDGWGAREMRDGDVE